LLIKFDFHHNYEQTIVYYCILRMLYFNQNIPNMKRNLLLLTCCFLFIGNSLFAQGSGKYGLPSPKDYDRWSVGLYFGQTYLSCDVLKDPDHENKLFSNIEFMPAFGLNVGFQVTHSIALRLGGGYNTLLAGPNPEKVGNIKMSNVELDGFLYEGTLDAVYTFGNISHLKRNKKFHFFAALGIGAFNFDTKLTGTTETTLTDTSISGSDSRLMIPVSLGFKYQIKKFDVALSWDYRKTFTDDIDLIRKPETEYDGYGMLKLGVNYTFGKKNKAMEWVNPMEVVYNDIADLKDKVDILSGDKDKDGVSDMFDKDNSTAEGMKVYGDGTSVDTDGDGIVDSKDGDPFSLKNAKVDANGVEIDTDGDGVADSRDLEPGTPKGQLVNFQGTSIKLGDITSTVVSFLPSIFFETNSSEIKQVYKDRILIVARAMKSNPDLKIMITGNTDLSAGDEFNDKLGLKRADAVKNHLVKVYGIDAARISTESKGEKEPMADTKNKTMNRRADFSIVK